MTRKRTWDVKDERRIRRSIQSSEDYQHETYHRVFLSADSGYGDMVDGSLNSAYPTKYVADGNDQYTVWSFVMPDSWQYGRLKARVLARPNTTTSGNCYTRIIVQYQPSGTNQHNGVIDSYETIPMTGGTGYQLYDYALTSALHERVQTSNDGAHIVGVRLERISTNAADTLTSTTVHFEGVLLEWIPDTYKV